MKNYYYFLKNYDELVLENCWRYLNYWIDLETEHYKSLHKFAQGSESVWKSLEREIPNTCQIDGLSYSSEEIKIRKELYDLC